MSYTTYTTKNGVKISVWWDGEQVKITFKRDCVAGKIDLSLRSDNLPFSQQQKVESGVICELICK